MRKIYSLNLGWIDNPPSTVLSRFLVLACLWPADRLTYLTVQGVMSQDITYNIIERDAGALFDGLRQVVPDAIFR